MTQKTNGAIRRMPDVTARVHFDGIYDGWWADVRVNAPIGIFLDLVGIGNTPEQIGQVLEMLAEITVASNFVDRKGEPIDMATADGWHKVGRDLIRDYIGRLPGALRDPFVAPTTNSSPPSSDTATPPQASTA